MTTTSVHPAWDDYFMTLARIISTRASCDRLHAGAVLVKDRRIVSTGYNGAPPGLPHCDDVGHLLEDGHCVRTIHGEHNALLQAAVVGGASTAGTTLYTLYSPCIHCTKYIIAAGVTRVVIGKVYRNPQAVELFEQAGITAEIYTPNDEWNTYASQLLRESLPDSSTAPTIQLQTEKS